MNGNGQTPARITLRIDWIPGQEPEITGPLHNKMLCYGLLEAARDAIKDFKPEEVSRIAVPELRPLQNLRS
jgi:hypothetical protein